MSSVIDRFRFELHGRVFILGFLIDCLNGLTELGSKVHDFSIHIRIVCTCMYVFLVTSLLSLESS